MHINLFFNMNITFHLFLYTHTHIVWMSGYICEGNLFKKSGKLLFCTPEKELPEPCSRFPSEMTLV